MGVARLIVCSKTNNPERKCRWLLTYKEDKKLNIKIWGVPAGTNISNYEFVFFKYLSRILHDISCVQIHGFTCHKGWKLLDFHRPQFALNRTIVTLKPLNGCTWKFFQMKDHKILVVTFSFVFLRVVRRPEGYGKAELKLFLPYFILVNKSSLFTELSYVALKNQAK